jgi:hypothetical protein
VDQDRAVAEPGRWDRNKSAYENQTVRGLYLKVVIRKAEKGK